VNHHHFSVVIAAIASLVVVATSAVPADALPLGRQTMDCPGVRPGAHVRTSEGTGGTLNFLFRGSDGHHYIGTAGHLLADEETHVWGRHGPTARIDDGTIIGRAAFAWNYNGEDADFAVIRLAKGVDFGAAVCHWGGPTGINNDISMNPTVLRLYGNGMGVSEVAPQRTLVAPTLSSESQVGALGLAVPGDSGSPVISQDGRALGLQFLVGVLLGNQADGFTPGNVAIYRLGPQIEAAEDALGVRLKLLKAPLADS